MESTVAVKHCADYEQSRVNEAVRGLTDLLGGIAKFVSPGERVLIKPNLMAAKSPGRAVTTHPTVVRAVIELVREAGATPVVGDSPAGAYKGIHRYWKKTGMLEICRETDTELVNFEKSGFETRSHNGLNFPISRAVLDADKIISLPKLKTHCLAIYTGAIKNMFGAMPGYSKGDIHRRFPRPVNFCNALVSLQKLVRPTLSIMDAVVGMEGNGPSSGEPREIGLMLAGDDPVAIDAVCLRVLGLDPMKMDTIKMAVKQDLGVAGSKEITIVGDDPFAMSIDDFDLPSNFALRMIPIPLFRLMERFLWVRPRFAEGCIGCGTCADSCPTHALVMESKRPLLDQKKCIQCLCCQETCPENQVELEFSRLAKFFM